MRINAYPLVKIHCQIEAALCSKFSTGNADVASLNFAEHHVIVSK